MNNGSVVPETSGVSEENFRNAMTAGLARARLSLGEKALAFIMDLTPKALGNIFRGGSTDPKRLWDAEHASPGTLDEVAALYGKRIVSADAVCLEGLGTLPLVQLLAKVVDAERPEGPGGVGKTHQELLDMEHELRVVNRLTGDWIEQIARIRTPRAVSG